MLLSSEQVVQSVYLGTVADVNSLVAALHDVDQTPGENGKDTDIFLKRLHNTV